jgi:tetratricopeptide (TPR) repeat protein
LKIREELAKSSEHAARPEAERRAFERNLARSHGYLGDAQKSNGNSAAAQESYQKAKQIRKKLAEDSNHAPDAACLHARDPRNLAALHEWDGKLNEALGEHRAAIAYYERVFSPTRVAWWGVRVTASGSPMKLPGEYMSERANSYLSAAELIADLPHLTPDLLAEADRHIAAAEREFTELIEQHPDSHDLRSGLVSVHLAATRLALVRDRHYHTSDRRPAATAALAAAERVLGDLEREVNFRFLVGDYYNLAVVRALRAELAPDAASRNTELILALDRLEMVKRKNYSEWHRLRRDVGFNVLRRDPAHGPAFANLLPAEIAPPRPAP